MPDVRDNYWLYMEYAHEILQIDKEQAEKMVLDAEDFIQEVELWLRKYQLL